MKTKILFITLLLLIVGCSKEPVNMDKMLNERDGVFYFKDTNKLYSGYYFNNDINGVIKNRGLIKNGKLRNQLVFNKSGYNLMTRFHKNGNKENEHFLINNEIWKSRDYDTPRYDSLFKSWYENGQIKQEGNYKDGNKHGLWSFWYENGQLKEEGTYKDGKLIISINSIVGYDWCYPSCNDDVQSSFKFSSDGTFNSSTIMFGGMSRWGTWEEINDNTFRLTTTRISTNSSNDQLPEPQIVTLTSDKKLRVGSTTYVGEH